MMMPHRHFGAIIQLIQQARYNALQTVNTELINLCWQIGGYLSHQLKQSDWGDKTVAQLAEYLQKHDPTLKGFERKNLYRMQQFYDTYKNAKFVPSVVSQITNNEIYRYTVATITGKRYQGYYTGNNSSRTELI